MTADWFKDAKMPSVNSFDDLKSRCKDKKHLIIDYFSPNCQYCYVFMPDFNKVYDDLNERYGGEQIDIVKINAWEAPQLSQMFGIPYFPFFVYVEPGSETCQAKSYFNKQPRNYENMMAWIMETIGD